MLEAQISNMGEIALRIISSHIWGILRPLFVQGVFEENDPNLKLNKKVIVFGCAFSKDHPLVSRNKKNLLSGFCWRMNGNGNGGGNFVASIVIVSLCSFVNSM
jgi:hypothetical protein